MTTDDIRNASNEQLGIWCAQLMGREPSPFFGPARFSGDAWLLLHWWLTNVDGANLLIASDSVYAGYQGVSQAALFPAGDMYALARGLTIAVCLAAFDLGRLPTPEPSDA